MYKLGLIKAAPAEDLGLVIVIPVYDEQYPLTPLKSLARNARPEQSVEVICVLNASENSRQEILERNRQAKHEMVQWVEDEKPFFDLHIIEENQLQEKFAGVGLARKIGMDEAAYRLHKVGFMNGIIACLDADTEVESNYCNALIGFFEQHSKFTACSIHFEHPLDSPGYKREVIFAIMHYELHLRYYRLGIAYAALPFAYHTIGSAMAVKGEAYIMSGGMNKRKAGEDFYFLQKYMTVNQLGSCAATTVYPSPRPSHRVPFGTGRAVGEFLMGERNIEESYDLRVFEELKAAFGTTADWYEGSVKINDKLMQFTGEGLLDQIEMFRQEAADLCDFRKRFFQWFNAFKTLKFIHFLRDEYFPNKKLVEQTQLLCERSGIEPKFKNVEGLLLTLREHDRSSGN